MKLSVFNQEGKEVAVADAPASLFDVPMNRDMLHKVIEAQIANIRIVHASTKDRAQVRGGGRKPWRQKGTGRARHGSIRSPLWKGGGVTHGPRKERNFFKKINRKIGSLALAMALSAKARDHEVVLLDSIAFESGKTKDAAGMLTKLSGNKPLAALSTKTALVLLPEGLTRETRALRNIKNVEVKPATAATAREVLAHSYILLPKDSLPLLEKRVSISPVTASRTGERTRTVEKSRGNVHSMRKGVAVTG